MRALLLLLSFIVVANGTAREPYSVGSRDFTFLDKARDRKITTHVWFPSNASADAKTPAQPQAQKGPFLPVVAAPNAPLPKGSDQYPVVLLSHGSMGLANRLFWLADVLVKNGIIVIAVDHPGNMFGNSSADGLMRVWDRPKDLRFALDEVLKTHEFQNRIDLSKVSVAGHSAGGAAALLLGGARFSFAQFTNPVPNCGGSRDPMYKKQCDELSKLDFKSYGKDVIEGDYSDPRIKSVVALDPGFTRSFNPQTLRQLKTPLVLIASKLAEPQDEIFSLDFLKLLKPSQAEVVPESVHMTFLMACRPGLEKVEDPELKELCADTQRKLQIQKRVAERTLRFLQSSWDH
ncbi:MAG: alpha/beta hydrolase family protein [Bdellovibrionia bacterium]